MHRIGKSIVRTAAVATASAGVLTSALTGTSQAAAGQQLMPDPDAYCVRNAPFSAQVNEADWQVLYQGLSGSPGQNNWSCGYLVGAAVPTIYNGGDSYTLPPFHYNVGIDWAAMCSQQYNASTLAWATTPGPIVTGLGPYGAPWLCVGAPGAVYDQSETVNGPVGRIR